MMENPVKVTDFKSKQEGNFRDEDASKVVGEPNFKFTNFKREKDRIKVEFNELGNRGKK